MAAENEASFHRVGIGTPVLLVVLALLASSAAYSFLLFHTLAELFSVMVAVLVGVIGWQTYPLSRNDFLAFLAAGYFWIGMLDLLHTLSYHGMGIMVERNGDVATQFWVATRYLEALVLLAAPWFTHHRVRHGPVFFGFGVVAFLIGTAVLTGFFPEAFRPGEGLTPFKVVSEYAIIALMAAALVHLYLRRNDIDRSLLWLMSLAIATTIGSEFAFTLYLSVYGLENFIGHIFKLISYWLIFVSLVQNTLTQPFRVLARGASTYDAIPDPTLLVDRSGLIRQGNRAAQVRPGRHDGIEGERVHALFHPAAWDEKECPVCRAIVGGAEEQERFEIHFPDTDRWELITVSPVAASAEGVSAVVHVSHDISGRKRSERELRRRHEEISSILSSVPDGVFGIDHDGRAVFVNPALEAITGWSAAEFIGQNTHTLLRHEGADGKLHSIEECAVHRTLQDGVTNRRDDDRFHRRDGSAFPVEFTSAPVRDAEGAITGAVVVFRDITQRKKTEAALLASEQKYRGLMENASDAILVIDRDGHFVDANRRAELLLGHSREELRVMTPADIHPPEEHERLAAAFRDMEEHGHSLHEHLVRRPDGSLLAVEVAGTRIDNADGVLYMGTFRDISERRQLEAERRRHQGELERTVAERTRELQAVNRELEAFSYSVSHDLRAPLRAVNGFSQALAEDFGDVLDGTAKGYLERMRGATERMSQMIDGLLGLSRVIRRELERRCVDLSEMAGELAEMMEAAGPERRVEWRIQPGLQAEGDPSLLRLLLQNLLENAWKFTAGREVGVIEVGAAHTERGAAFFVRDNGIGFDPRDSGSLFQPFHRLHRADEYEGTGIGLATVQRIVRRHGGDCWAEGVPGEGTTVYFSVPMGEKDVSWSNIE